MFTKNGLAKILSSGVAAVTLMFVLFMPFGNNTIQSITVIIDQ